MTYQAALIMVEALLGCLSEPIKRRLLWAVLCRHYPGIGDVMMAALERGEDE